MHDLAHPGLLSVGPALGPALPVFPLFSLRPPYFPVATPRDRATVSKYLRGEAHLWAMSRETRSCLRCWRSCLLNCECLINIHGSRWTLTLAPKFTRWSRQQTFLENNRQQSLLLSHLIFTPHPPRIRDLVLLMRKVSLIDIQVLLCLNMGVCVWGGELG